MEKYEIILTEKQLKIVKTYIETTMRLFMGQDWMFTDEISRLNHDLSPEDPHSQEIFNAYIIRRDHIREIMRTVYNIAFEPYGYLKNKTDDILEAETIWDAARTALGENRWTAPIKMGNEPIPKIKKITKEE